MEVYRRIAPLHRILPPFHDRGYLQLLDVLPERHRNVVISGMGSECLEFWHEILPLIRYDDIGVVWDELIAQVEGLNDLLDVSLDLLLA